MKPVQGMGKVPAHICAECEHPNNVFEMTGFQCSTRIISWLNDLCTPEDFKQLRLNPSNFVLTKLNAKLITLGKPILDVDMATKPITITICNGKSRG